MKATITISLSKEELEVIIRDALAKKGYAEVKNFRFQYGTRLVGYGPGESEGSYFDGVSCEVKKDI